MNVERVLGLTCSNGNGLSISPKKEEVAYIAGGIIVLYNLRRNKQVKFFSHPRANDENPLKTFSCLAFSFDGEYLAAGEKGHEPAVLIWDTKTCTLLAELKKHQY